MAKVTKWFDAALKPMPDRPGDYEVRNNPANPYPYQNPRHLNVCKHRYWDGRRWLRYKGWPEPSVMGIPGRHQWRGLTKPASK